MFSGLVSAALITNGQHKAHKRRAQYRRGETRGMSTASTN